MTRTAMSLHFLLCLMIPPTWMVPSLDGYLPMTAPKGPLILMNPLLLSIYLSLLQSIKLGSAQHSSDSLTHSLAEEMQTVEQQGTEVK